MCCCWFFERRKSGDRKVKPVKRSSGPEPPLRSRITIEPQILLPLPSVLSLSRNKRSSNFTKKRPIQSQQARSHISQRRRSSLTSSKRFQVQLRKGQSGMNLGSVSSRDTQCSNGQDGRERGGAKAQKEGTREETGGSSSREKSQPWSFNIPHYYECPLKRKLTIADLDSCYFGRKLLEEAGHLQSAASLYISTIRFIQAAQTSVKSIRLQVSSFYYKAI